MRKRVIFWLFTATVQPRNKWNSINHLPVSRSDSTNSFNHCPNLSAVVRCRSSLLQPHSTVNGGQTMTARVPSVVARRKRQLHGLLQPLRSLPSSSPELHQPLGGFIQRFFGLPQSLLHAYQSLKEANQPLQDVDNQHFGSNQPKNGVFQSTGNHTNHANVDWLTLFRVFRSLVSPFNVNLLIPIS